MSPRPASPTIAKLQDQLEAGETAALAEFWLSVKESGAPLIEECKEKPGHSWVTFLWRGKATNLCLFGGPWHYDDISALEFTRILNTDLWFLTIQLRNDARFGYRIVVDEPRKSLRDSTGTEEVLIDCINTKSQPNSLNPHKLIWKTDINGQPTDEWIDSIVELPEAPKDRWVIDQDDVPAGSVQQISLFSEKLNQQRKLWVNQPANFQPADEHPLLVFLDGASYLDGGKTPTMLDNLIFHNLIPPFLAVFVGEAETPTDRTRFQDYDCYQPFAEFLSHELVPFMRSEYGAAQTPATICGFSLGGLAAAYAAYVGPQAFGHVIAQSGSFGRPESPMECIDSDRQEHEWLTTQFAIQERLPIRFYLSVGLMERNTNWSDGVSLLQANRHLRDVLIAKAYPVEYHEFNGRHDMISWRYELSTALITLFAASAQHGTALLHRIQIRN